MVRIAVAVLLATLWSAATAAADVPWTVETSANSFGSGRQDYRYTVNPGGQVDDGIVIANRGTAPLHLAVHAGPWVHPARDDVTVAPGESVEVPFTLTLPDDAAPGDYVDDIVTSAGKQRIGIPIRLRVGGALKPSLSVEDVDVHYSKGDATVTYVIHNTGNAILSARQAVSLSGPFGRWEADAKKIADTPPLLPGDTRKVSAPVTGVVPALRLTATVTLVPLLTDAAGSIAPLPATKASGHAWAVPWSLLAAIVVLCGLVVAVLSRRTLRPVRRARRSRRP